MTILETCEKCNQRHWNWTTCRLHVAFQLIDYLPLLGTIKNILESVCAILDGESAEAFRKVVFASTGLILDYKNLVAIYIYVRLFLQVRTLLNIRLNSRTPEMIMKNEAMQAMTKKLFAYALKDMRFRSDLKRMWRKDPRKRIMGMHTTQEPLTTDPE